MADAPGSLVELRILEGPNLYFPRAAIKLTLDIGGLAAHGRLPSAGAVTTQVALAVRGARPTCEGLLDALGDHLASDAVATAEDLVALGLG